MPNSIFVSLPVKDVKKSVRFYEALGLEQNPQFQDENSACIVVSEAISIMLATQDKFRELTTKQLVDPKVACHLLLSLSCVSRAEVEEIMAKALAAGGTPAHEPEDYGFMYQHGFLDPDGHGWGLAWIDPAAMQQSGQA